MPRAGPPPGMPDGSRELPAVCRSCGAVFGSGTWVHPQVMVAAIRGSLATTNPCPRCSAVSRMPDGLYDLTRGLIELRASAAGVDDVRQFARALDAARASGEWSDVEAVLSTARGPISDLVRWLSTWKSNKANLVQVLLGVLVLLFGEGLLRDDPPPAPTAPAVATPLTDQDVERVVKAVVDELTKSSGPALNSRCYCGSGKKYKACHARPQEHLDRAGES